MSPYLFLDSTMTPAKALNEKFLPYVKRVARLS